MGNLNIYDYVLLPYYDSTVGTYDGNQPTIIVTGYTAGRPELEETGYEAAYIQSEQARLTALGYGYKE